MRRKIFFLLERLEINRSERIAVSFTLILLLITSSYFVLSQSGINYDADHYHELEKIFNERSSAIQQERDAILARYEPAETGTEKVFEPETAIADTIPPDTTKSEEEKAGSDLININLADAEELQELPGIGPAYSQRIIEWREENGEFTSKEQLLEIRGIGERRLEAIIPLIEL